MSGFIVTVRTPEQLDQAAFDVNDNATVAFLRKGMCRSLTRVGDGFVAHFFANDSHDPSRALSHDPAGRFCTYVGTLIYRGLTGADATDAILRDSRHGDLKCIDAAIGNFCVLIRDEGGLHIATDRAGLHHVYHDDSLSFVTNSFLAAASLSRHRTLQPQEVLEFVQLGATFGSGTLIREVQLLQSETEVQISGEHRRLIKKNSVWDSTDLDRSKTSVEQRIEETLRVCDEYYGQIQSTFGGKTTAALSGGYDSRLSLALMRRHHIAPRLFVYGAPHDSDVEIAKLICRSEALELNHIDRDARPLIEPDEYWQNQNDVFHGLDGLTQYGYACAPYEVTHRRERVAGGLLAVNGGGGEIWRDFWKLPDKPMRAEEFVRSYFGGRLGGMLGGKSAIRRFFLALADKVNSTVGQETDAMSPAVVQSLYSRFRLRFWQGKNNSVDNHLGYAVTPFSECQFSVPAMSIPISAKRDGWFERQLIRRVSPSLARYPSSYGYSFERGPSKMSMMKGSLTRHTPTWLRILRRSSDVNVRRPYYHADRYVRARFGGGRLEVEKYFTLDGLRDPLAFSRALTVERMCRDEWL